LGKIAFCSARLPNFGCVRKTKNSFGVFLLENSPVQPLPELLREGLKVLPRRLPASTIDSDDRPKTIRKTAVSPYHLCRHAAAQAVATSEVRDDSGTHQPTTSQKTRGA
jgi:hypothetical protein